MQQGSVEQINKHRDIEIFASQYPNFFDMNTNTFFKWLALVTLCTGVVLAGFHFFIPPAQEHGMFAIASLVLFALVCTGLFFAGASAAKSKSRVAFINLVSGSVFGKMVLALGFLYLYKQVAKPGNEWFVGIFLLCYVVYTGFEIWFMTRLART